MTRSQRRDEDTFDKSHTIDSNPGPVLELIYFIELIDNIDTIVCIGYCQYGSKTSSATGDRAALVQFGARGSSPRGTKSESDRVDASTV